ncbi:MAG TPA: MipA/OmpV family protein [Candidatus Omnitrophota bacterium]|jgi:outer membrane protein|nr:MipA/OmpV family protein [Candidatus Omnitrophota bacterium]
MKIPIIICFMVLSFFSLLVSPCAGTSLHARFKDFTDAHEEDLDITVTGLGVRYAESPYIDKDHDVCPVPLIVGRYKNFFMDGRKLGYVLKRFPSGDLSLVGVPRFNGYDHDDSPFLDGMDDRDSGIDGGIRCLWSHRFFSLELVGVSDLFNNHQGQEMKVLVSHQFYQGFLTPRVGVSWLNEDIVDYYYGVRGEESRPGRPAYEGGPAVNFTAGIQMALPVRASWVLVTDVQFEELGSKIEKSPLVDKQRLWTTVVGLVFHFQ